MKHYPPKRKLSLLLPPFQLMILTLMEALRARGHSPVLKETRRSVDRVRYLKHCGGSMNAFHNLYYGGAAACVVSAGFNQEKEFAQALSEATQELKLTCGIARAVCGSKTPQLYPSQHILAIPINLQREFKLIKTENRRLRYVTDYFTQQGMKPLIRVV